VATSYPPWKHGREYRSETHDSTSTEASPQILHTVENTWAQRTPLPAWIAAKASDAQPAHDVRLTQTVTTLADTGTDAATGAPNPHQVTKQTFTYDRYNNRTDVYEYDYGDGAVGPFRRRSHTDYLTINEINNADYASLMVNTSDPSGGSVIQPAEACQTCGEGGDDPGPTPTPTPGPTPLPTPNPTNPDLDATIHIRNLPTQQWVSADAAGNQKKTIITYEYDNYTPDAGNKHAALQARLTISGLDTTFTSSKQTRGNVTALTRRLIQESRDLTTYQQYDVAGNVVKVIDALGSATAFDFTDRFGVPSDNEARTNTVPAELVSANSYALATKVTLPSVGGSAQVTYTQYDYYTGKAVNAEDPNGTVYSGYYNDELDRPSMLVTAGADTALRTQTKFIYNDIDRTITTTSDRTTYDDDLLKSQVVYDGLGRTVETRSYEDATNYILVEQTYDGLGRVKSQSNPYRPVGTTPETAAWTTNTYDELGRITQVQTPDNAKINTTYKGNATTVRDQALKKRESRVDALGRLVEVIEDPDGVAYQTSYQYDVLDNLTKVVQGGQTRTFTYDSLKRLVQAVNPESGTIKYEYDDNGNLVKKIDPRKVTTTPLVYLEMTFAYDALNRVTSKTYNDNGETPSVIYKYDAQALPTGAPGAAVFDRGASTGRLVAVTYGGTAWGTYYGYDGLGRVSEKVQRTDGINYEVNATYNRAGAMLTETYPVNPETGARRVVTRTFDGAGRLRSLSTAGASVTNIQYAAHGALESETYGTLLHQINYNTRLQPTAIELGTNADDPTSKLNLSYTYGTTYNSGNIASAKITVGTTEVWNQTFTYDALNRLDIAKEVKDGTQQWMQKNEYDRYGNRWQVVDGNPSLTFNTANNRITTAGYSYDLAGNLTSMPRGDQTLNVTYDAENHIKSVGADAAYVYDGEGQRVRKLLGENLLMVYGIGGELLAEFDGAAVNKPLKKEYIYGADGLLATIAAGEGTRYITADHLGSPRIITTASGGVVNRHDYEPFGEELFVGMGGRTSAQGYNSETDSLRQKFTGKERDNETGLDYFGARYYASMQGRFTSSDPMLMDHKRVIDPQRINAYVYARNNPLKFIDPDGKDPQGLQIIIKKDPYPVNGQTATEAVQDARKNAPHYTEQGLPGETQTDYDYQVKTISWSASRPGQGGGVDIDVMSKDVEVKATITITLPEWEGYEEASPEEQQKWDSYIDGLEAHEKEHEAIGIEGAKELQKTLQNTSATGHGKTPEEALQNGKEQHYKAVEQNVERIKDKYQDKQDKLDEDKDHGRKP
jgi:RHS repeat-associated protein